jgi:pimeloyl-ACP methyl ester carboxylesterase
VPTFGGKQLWADEFVHRGYRIQLNVVSKHHRLLGPRDVRLHRGSYEACLRAFDALPGAAERKRQSDHVVLLLHGLFRAKDAFQPMESALRQAGFEAEAVNYPSTQTTIEDHAEQLERLLSRLRGVKTVSFVTHSLGGIVARELLGREGAWKAKLSINRLVMIATPNQGARMADTLLPSWAFRRLAGPAGTQLTTDYAAVVPAPSVPFGIVAGVRGDGKGFNPLLKGDDDIIVAKESTHLDGAEDTLVVKAIHTFIMQRREVMQGTIRYLRTGRFTDST